MRYLIANLLIFSTIGANSPIQFRGMHPVRPAPDGNIYLEAEEFTPEEDSDWKAKPWERKLLCGYLCQLVLKS